MELSKLKIKLIDRDGAADLSKLLPAEEMSLIGSRSITAIGAWYSDTPCGALVLESAPPDAALRYLFVDGRIRRRGVGGYLLKAACMSCRKKRIQLLRADYVPGDFYRDGPGDFLKHFGFEAEGTGKRCYVAPLAAASSSSFITEFSPDSIGAGVVPLTKLPPAAKVIYRSEIGRVIPKHASPAHAVGKVLDAYSLAFVENNQVMTSNLFSIVDGEVLLEAIFIRNPLYTKRLLNLLRYSIGELARVYPQSSLRVVVATPKMYQLAERLLEGVFCSREDMVTLRYDLK